MARFALAPKPPQTTMRPQPGWRNMPTIEVTHKELRAIGTTNNECAIYVALFGVGVGGFISLALALYQGNFSTTVLAMLVGCLGLSIVLTFLGGIMGYILINKSHRDVEEIWKERRCEDDPEGPSPE